MIDPTRFGCVLRVQAVPTEARSYLKLHFGIIDLAAVVYESSRYEEKDMLLGFIKDKNNCAQAAIIVDPKTSCVTEERGQMCKGVEELTTYLNHLENPEHEENNKEIISVGRKTINLMEQHMTAHGTRNGGKKKV